MKLNPIIGTRLLVAVLTAGLIAGACPITQAKESLTNGLAQLSDAVPKDASVPAAVMASNDPASAQTAESVTVTATKLPGRSAVDEFIYSYPAPARTTDKIARW